MKPVYVDVPDCGLSLLIDCIKDPEVYLDQCECCGRWAPEQTFTVVELRGGDRFACQACVKATEVTP